MQMIADNKNGKLKEIEKQIEKMGDEKRRDYLELTKQRVLIPYLSHGSVKFPLGAFAAFHAQHVARPDGPLGKHGDSLAVVLRTQCPNLQYAFTKMQMKCAFFGRLTDADWLQTSARGVWTHGRNLTAVCHTSCVSCARCARSPSSSASTTT